MSDLPSREVAAVLVIDMQEGMFDGRLFPPIYDADTLEGRVQNVISWARRTGRKIAFIRHDAQAGQALAPGAPGWPLRSPLGRRDDEPIFSKTLGDAFSKLELRQWIENLGVTRVVLLGAQTDQCVAATLAGALEHGLNIVVVSDGHSTWDSDGETACEIIIRYNEKFSRAGTDVLSAEALTAN